MPDLWVASVFHAGRVSARIRQWSGGGSRGEVGPPDTISTTPEATRDDPGRRNVERAGVLLRP